MEAAIKYLSDKSEKTNKIHWMLIAIGIIWYLIAVSTTYIVLSEKGEHLERNPLAAIAFQYIGMIPTFIITLIAITAVMIYIPYIFKEHKWIGIACNVGFATFFLLDGGHNAYIFFEGKVPLETPYLITNTIMLGLGL